MSGRPGKKLIYFSQSESVAFNLIYSVQLIFSYPEIKKYGYFICNLVLFMFGFCQSQGHQRSVFSHGSQVLISNSMKKGLIPDQPNQTQHSILQKKCDKQSCHQFERDVGLNPNYYCYYYYYYTLNLLSLFRLAESVQ